MSQLQTQSTGHSHTHSKGHACGCGCDHGAKKQISFLQGKAPIIVGVLIVAAVLASFFFKF